MRSLAKLTAVFGALAILFGSAAFTCYRLMPGTTAEELANAAWDRYTAAWKQEGIEVPRYARYAKEQFPARTPPPNVDKEKQWTHYMELLLQPVQFNDLSWHTGAYKKNWTRDVTTSTLRVISAVCAAVIIVAWSIKGIAQLLYLLFREAARGIKEGTADKPK